MGALFGLYPFLLKLYADGGYQGPNFLAGLRSTCRHVNLEIVKRSELRNFVVLPKRWIVERTIAWLNRCRRLAKDWECLNRSALVNAHVVGAVRPDQATAKLPAMRSRIACSAG